MRQPATAGGSVYLYLQGPAITTTTTPFTPPPKQLRCQTTRSVCALLTASPSGTVVQVKEKVARCADSVGIAPSVFLLLFVFPSKDKMFYYYYFQVLLYCLVVLYRGQVARKAFVPKPLSLRNKVQ